MSYRTALGDRGAVVRRDRDHELPPLHALQRPGSPARPADARPSRNRATKLAGVRVAALGLVGFVFLLATTFVQSAWARAAALTVSLAAVIFGAYLLVVQLVVIDAVCVWCVASDCLILLIAGIAVADATGLGRKPEESRAPPHPPATPALRRS